MLTVKVIRNCNKEDGLSLEKTTTISAVSSKTGYHLDKEGNFLCHYVTVEDYKGNVYSFDLTEGTRIFVENLTGKTVQAYHYSHI
ncbi:hypothetical protein VPHD51_0046 [Vibrio phage D51]